MKLIIVIDMIDAFCTRGNLASERLSRLVTPIREYLERESAAGARALFLVDTHEPDDPEFAVFPAHAVAGSGEDEVVAELADIAERSIVIRKARFSGFHETRLDDELARLAPDEVEVVGVCTDICVLHTVAGLRDRGYSVTVRADLVDTYDVPGHPAAEMHAFALQLMRDTLGARISMDSPTDGPVDRNGTTG